MWIVLSLGNDALPKLDMERNDAKRWTLCAPTGCTASLFVKIFLKLNIDPNEICAKCNKGEVLFGPASSYLDV